MANLRMPVSGDDFVRFVRNAEHEDPDLSYFPTYVHLIATAAAYALREGVYELEPEVKDRQP